MRTIRSLMGSDDSGLTLVEIVIYITLAVVVGTIVTSMFIGTLKGQDQVTSTTQATTQGQVAAQAIEKAVRNSTAVQVSPDGQTLSVLSTVGAECQAWRLRGGNLEVSTGAGFTSWGVFATGVEAVDGAATPFGFDNTTITYSLSFDTDTQPVEFTGGVTPRGTGGNLAATCS